MTKAEQVPLVAWRLKILQHASGENHTVTQTCRFFGISRKTYNNWANRRRTHGDAGLCDRARVASREAVSPHVEIELYIFAVVRRVSADLSLGAATYIVKTVWDHAFPHGIGQSSVCATRAASITCADPKWNCSSARRSTASRSRKISNKTPATLIVSRTTCAR